MGCVTALMITILLRCCLSRRCLFRNLGPKIGQLFRCRSLSGPLRIFIGGYCSTISAFPSQGRFPRHSVDLRSGGTLPLDPHFATSHLL